ncbi:hypothetical protein KVH31_34780 [Streptomyces olivaceus]|uniref:hypothetical protein n=1 Tax=Streptomyces olivaceus TaxID=47716 RepID=UPI001CCF771B|nr:hypothetical protein [Streptomyces olivaceus]MBZ6211664.1 hypothetical protein [Streptomyces olivaceus]
MTTTATPTVDSLIHDHATDLAYVAEKTTPATDLPEFIHHLTYATENFALAGINGHEDLYLAATLLSQTDDTDGAGRDALLKRAAVLLRPTWEMTTEYREMVGD